MNSWIFLKKKKNLHLVFFLLFPLLSKRRKPNLAALRYYNNRNVFFFFLSFFISQFNRTRAPIKSIGRDTCCIRVNTRNRRESLTVRLSTRAQRKTRNVWIVCACSGGATVGSLATHTYSYNTWFRYNKDSWRGATTTKNHRTKLKKKKNKKPLSRTRTYKKKKGLTRATRDCGRYFNWNR